MSDLDLVGLRKIAEAADTGVRWISFQPEGHKFWAVESDELPSKYIAVPDEGKVDAEHIAAFDPPTVLALLDRIEELERAISEIPKHCGGSFTADDGYTSVAVADGEAIKEILEGVKHDREDQRRAAG